MSVPGIEPGILTEGFLSSHPDMRWRREGLYSYNQEEYDIAMDQFLRAARYADKPSQAMIAEMYWKGIGVPRDRELGYAWRSEEPTSELQSLMRTSSAVFCLKKTMPSRPTRTS